MAEDLTDKVAKLNIEGGSNREGANLLKAFRAGATVNNDPLPAQITSSTPQETGNDEGVESAKTTSAEPTDTEEPSDSGQVDSAEAASTKAVTPSREDSATTEYTRKLEELNAREKGVTAKEQENDQLRLQQINALAQFNNQLSNDPDIVEWQKLGPDGRIKLQQEDLGEYIRRSSTYNEKQIKLQVQTLHRNNLVEQHQQKEVKKTYDEMVKTFPDLKQGNKMYEEMEAMSAFFIKEGATKGHMEALLYDPVALKVTYKLFKQGQQATTKASLQSKKVNLPTRTMKAGSQTDAATRVSNANLDQIRELVEKNPERFMNSRVGAKVLGALRSQQSNIRK
jgi:hypothetical protein